VGFGGMAPEKTSSSGVGGAAGPTLLQRQR
jgi:hypothetical protein